MHYLGKRSLPCYVVGWFVLLRIIPLFGGGLYADSWLSLAVMFVSLLALTMAIHDVLCRIPGVERYLFGRNKHLPGLLSEIRSARGLAAGPIVERV